MRVPAWTDGVAWSLELRRQCAVMRARSALYSRFRATCRQLEAWRLNQVDAAELEAVAPIVENAHRNRGRLVGLGGFLSPDTGWTRAELGELVVLCRNRLELLRLGRDRPRAKGPCFDLARLPDDRLEALIQSHPDLKMVDRLRDERRRRQQMELAL